MKNGILYLLNNAGKAIALITLLVATLVTFTDIAFADFSAKSFTCGTLLLLLASYLMYFSLEDAGEDLAKESENYIETEKEYENTKNRITASDIEELRKFCILYSEKDLKYRKKCMLTSYAQSDAEYERYLTGEPVSRRKLRIFKKVSRLRAVQISPRDILTRDKAPRRSELQNPENEKIPRLLLRFIPTIFGMCITVSIMLTSKENLDASMVIEGILKLSALPIIGLRGYKNGYNYVKERYIPWVQTKIRIIEEFLSAKDTLPHLTSEE